MALAVAFETVPLDIYELSEVGRLAFSDGYPDVQVQAPISPIVEPQSFKPTGPPNFELVAGLPRMRLWFRSMQGTQLVQLQDDWISCNWQRGDQGAEYPQYHDAIRSFFSQNLDRLSEVLAEKDVGDLLPVQCEVSYINHIERDSLWQTFGDVNRVLKSISPFDGFMGQPEGVELAMHFPLTDRSGKQRGRMHVTLQPALKAADEEPVFVLTLTGRGRPFPGEGGVMSFMDLAHDWIVNGFTELVTDEALSNWGFDR